jgi:hypothetical protein
MIKKPQTNLILLDTLLSLVKNSIGSNTFRNVYFNVNGKKTDLAENGNLSCAVFVSSILFLLKLIKDVHITVESTLKDLKKTGWIETQNPKHGCILIWAKKDFGNGGIHRHIGFCINKRKAVSNNSQYGYPTEHNLIKYDGRKVELILENPSFYDKK